MCSLFDDHLTANYLAGRSGGGNVGCKGVACNKSAIVGKYVEIGRVADCSQGGTQDQPFEQ